MYRKLAVIFAAAIALCASTPAFAAGPVVYVANLSTVVPQADVVAALPAFQIAVSRDLAAAWGTDATLTTDPAAEPTAAMVVRIEDDAQNCGCLGYHDVLGGKPTSWIYAGTSASAHDSWQLVFTHELFEMLVDPWINRFALWHDRTWLVEVCDPPESGFYAYLIDGVVISDFITPRWYDRSLPGLFDFTGRFRKSGQIGRHGYASYRDPSVLGGWGQVFGFHARPHMDA